MFIDVLSSTAIIENSACLVYVCTMYSEPNDWVGITLVASNEYSLKLLAYNDIKFVVVTCNALFIIESDASSSYASSEGIPILVINPGIMLKEVVHPVRGFVIVPVQLSGPVAMRFSVSKLSFGRNVTQKSLPTVLCASTLFCQNT